MDRTRKPVPSQRSKDQTSKKGAKPSEKKTVRPTDNKKTERKPVNKTAPVSKRPFVQKTVQIPVTDNVNTVMDVISQYNVSFVSGYTSTGIVTRIMEELRQTDTNNKFLFCFRNKNIMKEYIKTSPFKGKHLEVDYNTNVETIEYDYYRVLFCTTSKAKSIINNLRTTKRLDVLSHVLIHSWDDYDPNAFVIYGLLQMEEFNAAVILTSVSRYANIPKINNKASIVFSNDNLKFLYYDNRQGYKHLISNFKGETVFYGNNSGVEGVISQTYPVRIPEAQNVVDTLRTQNGKPITKHIASLRANTIDKGVIHVVETSSFKDLKPNFKESYFKGLDKVVVWMKINRIPITILPENQQVKANETLSILPEGKATQVVVNQIMKSGIGIHSGILCNVWSAHNLKKIKEGLDKLKKFDTLSRRKMYVPTLVCALIDSPPSFYADVESYTPFLGRNDIETMSLVWLDLINSHNYPFYLWDEHNKETIIRDWCKKNSFNVEAIKKLFYIISTFYNASLAVVENITSKTGTTFKDNFSALSTRELNIALSFIASSKLYKLSSTKSINVSETISPFGLNDNGVYILHARGDCLQMYLPNVKLIEQVYGSEDLSSFVTI